ncbi:phage tail protein [bacterium]|nr:phage tail protein [bacterium]MBR5554859.1 phage tail protein [bacterium]
MAEEFYSLVTDYGAEKQLRCITDGLPFEVTHIALGDGNGRYYEPSTSQTKLVNEVWRGNIEKCEWIENRFYCVTTVPAEVGGFDVREAGVFDEENNLLVITKFPETTKQAPESGTVKQLTIRIELEMSNTQLAELVINPNLNVVTMDVLDETLNNISDKYQKLDEKGVAGGYAPVGEDGLIPNAFIPEPETKSILTPFCLNSCRLDTKGNPNLLSSETVKIWQYTSSSLGVFYTAQEVTLAKDVVVYKDTELSEEVATIVAIDTSGLTISFGTIETLSEYEDEPLHYSATNYGEFYVKESLVLGAECFSDADCTQLMGVVTFLNLTRISIGEVETYTFDGNQTTHIYITANAPFTYTTATSKTHHVEKNLVLDVIDLCPDDSSTKNFNLFVNHESDGYCLVALSNTIFTQMLEPTDYQANDIWFKILEPLASYIYLLNIWQETNLVPVGVFTLEGGEK